MLLISEDELQNKIKSCVQDALHEFSNSIKQPEIANNDRVNSKVICTRYNISQTTLWRLVKKGEIHPMHIGGRRLYDPLEFENLK